MKKRLTGKNIFDFCNILIMLAVIVATGYPFLHVINASFSDPYALATHTGVLLTPLQPVTTSAYKLVFSFPQLLTGYKNTIFILVAGTITNMLFTITGAYFLALKGPKLKTIITFMIVFTMYFGGGMVPGYLNIRDLGLLNTHGAIILSGAIGTSNLIIMTNAFRGVPDSLVEAAHLDGASHAQILTKVLIPLTKATLAVLVLYYGVGHWNSWFQANIYLQDSSKFPLQLILRNLFNSTAGLEGMEDMADYVELIKYALIVVSTVPILVLYPFLQKHFTKGVMVGAIKG